jgi:predicted TIM-barrel fold metal-dependent hydrolase
MSSSLPYSPRPTRISAPSVAVPAGATDCHFHIFGPRVRYPLAPSIMYDPQEASVEDYLAMATTLGLQRRVVVQASVYGVDNRCLVDSIEGLGRDRTRGIAVIDTSITDEGLQQLHAAGVRGIRFNAISGGTSLDDLPVLAGRIAPLGWHVQLWVKGERLPSIEPVIAALPVPVCIDHLGQIAPSKGLSHPEFKSLERCLRAGRTWVKLCGYRASAQDDPYDDVLEQVRAIIATAPDRCMWGTDWPHPLLEHRAMPDPGRLLDLLRHWAGDDATFRRILVDNPAVLYGFA